MEPSSAEPLNTELHEDYRLLHSLSSQDATTRHNALLELPEKIAQFELHQFLDLALGVGQAVTWGSEGLKRVGSELPAHLTAETYAHGVAALRDWPSSFLQMGEEFVGRDAEHEEHFWNLLTRLRDHGGIGRFPASFLRSELPGLTSNKRRSIAALTDEPMGTRELQLGSGLQSFQMHKLRDAGVLGDVHRTGRSAASFQIMRAVGEEIIQLRRSFRPIGSSADKLGLPIYTVEQLSCLGLLTAGDHEALIVLEESPRIAKNSLADLASALEAKCCDDGEGQVSLRAACSALYVGEKPYAKIIAGILSGTVRASINLSEHKRSRALLSRIQVSIDDLASQRLEPFRAADYPDFRFADTYIQRDAADVLSVRNVDIQQAVAEGTLDPTRGANGSVRYARSEILAAANLHISASAIMNRLRVRSPRQLSSWCSFHGLHRGPLGWPRQNTLDRLDLLGL